MVKDPFRGTAYVGICPACKEPVRSDDPDGPVWTCPADLDPKNPYWEPQEAKDPENWTEQEQGWVSKGTFTAHETARAALADMLKANLEEDSLNMLEEASASASMWSDLLGAALSEVNWQDIAETFLEG